MLPPALSLSLFILFQGGWPIFWTSIAEVIGRKPVYLTSYSLFILGTVVASRAETMPVLIGMRMIQAFGSSSVMACGAGSLADIYEPRERGTRMGFYYAVPLLGPSLGPLIGGALTSAYSWRSTFYFIAAIGGISLVSPFPFSMSRPSAIPDPCSAPSQISFIFFPDTWRKERSLAYQTALKRSVAAALRHQTDKDEKAHRKARSGHATPIPETRPTSPMADVDVEVGKKGALGRRKWWIVGKRQEKVEGEFKVRRRFHHLLPRCHRSQDFFRNTVIDAGREPYPSSSRRPQDPCQLAHRPRIRRVPSPRAHSASHADHVVPLD